MTVRSVANELRDSASRLSFADRVAAGRGSASLARALLRRTRHILLFSHERSYSSLLGHLLGSHPEITGYSEQHRSYLSDDDLAESCCEVWRLSDHRIKGRYVFDKLLHNEQLVNDHILQRRTIYPLYGLREPIGSVRSLVAMAQRAPTKKNWRSNPESAAHHLFNRYAALAELSRRRERAAVLFMDSIVSDTRPTLDALGDYLGLRSPIPSEYGSFSKTGVGRFGDPMGPIASGSVQAQRPGHDVDVPDELADRLWRSYAKTADELSLRCTSSVGTPVGTPLERS